MGVVKQSIIVEDRFREIFNYLPNMKDDNLNEFPIVFDGGDERELNAFLTTKQGDSRPYPLIWLVYPFKEIHTKKEVKLDSVTFILAVETNSEMLNKQRLDETFKKILFPLLFNIRKAFEKACIININDEYEIIKHPNYSSDENGEQLSSIELWDALKVTFDCSINNSCLRPLKI